jgi:hypothetical protein
MSSLGDHRLRLQLEELLKLHPLKQVLEDEIERRLEQLYIESLTEGKVMQPT